jgi:hypothetical protein
MVSSVDRTALLLAMLGIAVSGSAAGEEADVNLFSATIDFVC